MSHKGQTSKTLVTDFTDKHRLTSEKSVQIREICGEGVDVNALPRNTAMKSHGLLPGYALFEQGFPRLNTCKHHWLGRAIKLATAPRHTGKARVFQIAHFGEILAVMRAA